MKYEMFCLAEIALFLESKGLCTKKSNNIFETDKLIECTATVENKSFIHFTKSTEEYLKGNYYTITDNGFKKEVIGWI